MVKYGFVCTLQKHKGKPTIYISEKSIKTLRTIVIPHMIPCMFYKVGLGINTKPLPTNPVSREPSQINFTEKKLETPRSCSFDITKINNFNMDPINSQAISERCVLALSKTVPEKFQRQGIYQQEINKLTDSPKWQFLNQFNHKFLE
jgi:hypothetical protein